MSEVSSEDLRRIIKLFNRWQFEEAANELDKLSPHLEGTDKQVIEGLALLAHGCNRIWHKGGEAHAMVKYLEDCAVVMRRAGTNSLGIKTEGLAEAVNNCLTEAIRWRRGEVDIFNRDLLPRIEFISGFHD